MSEDFKKLKIWVEKCPIEAAMRIEELEDKNNKLEIDVSELKEYTGQIEHEKQLLYGRLNMIRDLTDKKIK